MEEVLEEGIEVVIPSTMGSGDGRVGDSSVGDGSRDETTATDVVPESPRRNERRVGAVVRSAFLVLTLFAVMMSVGVAIGRSFKRNANASQAASTGVSENAHTGSTQSGTWG